jgi:hypothetical protein
MGIADGKFGKEIVRMLAVNQRLSFVRFSCLKQQGISFSAYRKRIEGKHGIEVEQAFFPNVPLSHKHCHVWGIEFSAAPTAIVKQVLFVIPDVYITMQHKHPVL